MIRTHLLNLGMSNIAFAMADVTGAGTAPEETDLTPGSNIESETGFLSLAQLAGADTDSIQTLTSRTPPAGIWNVRGKKVALTQGEPKDGKPGLFRVGFQYEVMGGSATDPTFDNEKMIGRTLTESFTIWPNDIAEGIGLLKGRYQKVNLANSGMPLGGVDGLAPGWLDGALGHEFDIKIRTSSSNGELRAYYDWLPPSAVDAIEEDA